MPELPEVETVRAGLERHVVGRTIAKAELEAQIALLDQLVADYDRELGESTQDPTDLNGQLERLNASIAQSEQALHRNNRAYGLASYP